MVLTTEERVWLVEHVFREAGRHIDVVRQRFAEKFPDTPVPHRNAVRNLVDKFWETGSVNDAKRCGRSAKLSEEKLLDISDSVMQSPSKSLRKLAQQHDIGLGTAHKAVRKKLKLFPYKIMAVQELEATDNEKRIRYCRWFNRFIEENTANVLDVTFFTDEAWFHLSGYVNSQNSRLWSSRLFIYGEQQNLQCIEIVRARWMT
ncbi:uncharacterized protein LOC143230330 [Tachypleus tridentatus]|uniref:uncharacterized protein LOC143230330 n=1 Tax=Tachypleus tridentatus TaxID=6853 RepID=UPI003FD4BE90